MSRVSLFTRTTWGLAGATAVAGMSLYNTNAGLTISNASYIAAGKGEYYFDGTGWISKNPATAAYVEHWNIMATLTPATTNAQNIYKQVRSVLVRL